MVPGQRPGVYEAVVEILDGCVERFEVYPTSRLAYLAAVRICLLEGADKEEARQKLKEECRYDHGRQSVQLVRCYEASCLERDGVPHLTVVKPKRRK